MAELQWSDERVRVGDSHLVVLKAGSGPPLVVFHEELGCPGTVSWQETLAESHTLLIPQHPGFGRTDRAEWLTGVRDLANSCWSARWGSSRPTTKKSSTCSC